MDFSQDRILEIFGELLARLPDKGGALLSMDLADSMFNIRAQPSEHPEVTVDVLAIAAPSDDSAPTSSLIAVLDAVQSAVMESTVQDWPLRDGHGGYAPDLEAHRDSGTVRLGYKHDGVWAWAVDLDLRTGQYL